MAVQLDARRSCPRTWPIVLLRVPCGEYGMFTGLRSWSVARGVADDVRRVLLLTHAEHLSWMADSPAAASARARQQQGHRRYGQQERRALRVCCTLLRAPRGSDVGGSRAHAAAATVPPSGQARRSGGYRRSFCAKRTRLLQQPYSFVPSEASWTGALRSTGTAGIAIRSPASLMACGRSLPIEFSCG